ncbi:uncharacterized protein LOC114929600 [Nylanderia fulva]|uniref:uncharacterized protein LOC114929600 n=1 Tax=Nylanderia fulva TaxID=613905 RepID=UPI0010FAF0B7|nr:uncharacterized protein LOC114929600 [Nylanderia fulva]
MASKPEKTNEPKTELATLEPEDLSNEKKNEENIEMEMLSNSEQKNKPKTCEEDPYIVKLFKSLIKPESQKSVEKKKCISKYLDQFVKNGNNIFIKCTLKNNCKKKNLPVLNCVHI